MKIRDRIKGESPRFFKRITNFGLIMAGVGTAVLTLATGGLALPVALVTYSGYAVAVGTALSIPSKLVVKNYKEDEKENI